MQQNLEEIKRSTRTANNFARGAQSVLQQRHFSHCPKKNLFEMIHISAPIFFLSFCSKCNGRSSSLRESRAKKIYAATERRSGQRPNLVLRRIKISGRKKKHVRLTQNDLTEKVSKGKKAFATILIPCHSSLSLSKFPDRLWQKKPSHSVFKHGSRSEARFHLSANNCHSLRYY